jgi:hypothetical protein
MARNIDTPDTFEVQGVRFGEWLSFEDFMKMEAPGKLVHGIRFDGADGRPLTWDADHGWYDYWNTVVNGNKLSRCERSVRILGVTK